ncbi:MAG: biotin/lipoate A/B protein ligase family protein [Candidatus Atabeyarchaeum deiterrae]
MPTDDDWRFLEMATCTGASNMATDEAILIARAKGLIPNTVRLYQWKPSAVSVGYFQRIEEVVNIEACKRYGIDIVRRISGGGAVYHSQNEVTYSVVVTQRDPALPNDPIEVYKKLCNALISVPSGFGLQACFEAGHPGLCPNMVIAGKKISGNAQARKKGVILQHGTLLLDCDLNLMAEVLKLPKHLVHAKVTTLRRELGEDDLRKVETVRNMELIQRALLEGFRKSLKIKLKQSELTCFEQGKAKELKAKYESEEWTYRR